MEGGSVHQALEVQANAKGFLIQIDALSGCSKSQDLRLKIVYTLFNHCRLF